MESAKSKINELTDMLLYYNRMYYEKDSPVVSDEEYDSLMKELADLEAMYPEYAREDSPARNVGGRAAEGFSKVTHIAPMLSLANAYSEEELREYLLKLEGAEKPEDPAGGRTAARDARDST